jgi:hypothetical protein
MHGPVPPLLEGPAHALDVLKSDLPNTSVS